MAILPVPRQQRRVFQDSSSYAALLDRRDANHEIAQAILGAMVDAHYHPFTTNVILIEAHALILSNMGNRDARQFLQDMRQSSTTIVRVRARDEEQAQEILFHYTDKEWSFADATSFVVMKRLGIQYAFTFDSDFTQYGLTNLTPEPLH